MGRTCETLRIHERGSVAELVGILECSVGVRECSLGEAKHPQRQRPPGQDYHSAIQAKSRCQRPVLGRIVKRERLIKMRPAFRDASCEKQGNTHGVMRVYERDGRPLLCGKRQDLARELKQNIAVKRPLVRDP